MNSTVSSPTLEVPLFRIVSTQHKDGVEIQFKGITLICLSDLDAVTLAGALQQHVISKHRNEEENEWKTNEPKSTG